MTLAVWLERISQGKRWAFWGQDLLGGTLARMLQGFGCKVLAYDVNPRSEMDPFCDYASLDEVVECSRVLSLNMPLTKETLHTLNSERLSNMQEGAFFG